MPEQTVLDDLYRIASAFVVSKGWGEVPDGRESVDRFGRVILGAESEGRPVNYLEVGTGTGVLFRHMKRLGHVCHGIDPGSWCKMPEIFSAISDLPADVMYDVVVLQDVLEHVVSPLDMMIACRAKVGIGARIYCTFPNRDSWLARHGRERWRMVRPLGHLHYFSRKSLELLFIKSGWSIRCLRASHGGNFFDLLRTRQFAGALSHLMVGKDQWSVQGDRS